jgi:hypothetical protein
MMAGSGHQCYQRIVDDHRRRLLADAAHDLFDGVCVSWSIDTRNTNADGGEFDIAFAERLVHHAVKNLFDGELTHHLKIGSGRARMSENLAAIVCEQAHRLRSSSINAEYVHTSAQV